MSEAMYEKPKPNFSQENANVFKTDLKKFGEVFKSTVTITLSNGKDKNGEWKKSTFLDVVYFGEEFAYKVGQLQPKMKVNIQGNLKTDFYVGKDGADKSKLFVNGSYLELS